MKLLKMGLIFCAALTCGPDVHARNSLFRFIYGKFGGQGTVSRPDQALGNSRDRYERETRAPSSSAQLGTTAGRRTLASDEAKSFKLFGEPCRLVINRRKTLKPPDTLTVMIPVETKAEWDSFQAAPPPGIQIKSCYCDRPLWTSQITAGLIDLTGSDPAMASTWKPPRPGQTPQYNARQPTAIKLCRLLGCTGAALLYPGSKHKDPSDNTHLRWNGAIWDKFPAEDDNYNLAYRSPALFCNL